MSALAFVWRGGGVLGVPACEFVRCGDGVLGVPGARGKGAEPCSARSSAARGGVASCGAATACWPCQVAALSAGSQRGAVLGPAPRFKAGLWVSLRDGNSSSPTAPRAKPLRIAGESDPRAPVTHRLGLLLSDALSKVQSLELAFLANN